VRFFKTTGVAALFGGTEGCRLFERTIELYRFKFLLSVLTIYTVQ
jgi:hypothetical protein